LEPTLIFVFVSGGDFLVTGCTDESCAHDADISMRTRRRNVHPGGLFIVSSSSFYKLECFGKYLKFPPLGFGSRLRHHILGIKKSCLAAALFVIALRN
jgi:hypothetical protein